MQDISLGRNHLKACLIHHDILQKGISTSELHSIILTTAECDSDQSWSESHSAVDTTIECSSDGWDQLRDDIRVWKQFQIQCNYNSMFRV